MNKIDRAYEMAGLARMDGDKVDELRHLNEAQTLQNLPPIVPGENARTSGWVWFPVEQKWMKKFGDRWVEVDTAHQAVTYSP